MKYSVTETINIDIQTAWDWFVDPANIKTWQPTFVSMEMLEGDAGQPGNKNRMTFIKGNGTMDMIELIEEIDPPNYMKAIYTAPGVYNINEMKFTATGDQTTQVEMESYFEFSGIMKLMSMFMKGLFMKESQKSL